MVNATGGELMVRIGAGTHQYEVVEDWPRLPDGFVWGQVVQAVVDRDDTVLFFHRGSPGVLRFAPDGGFLGAWPENSHFQDIHAALLVSDADGDGLLVVDRDRNTLVRTTLDGEIVWELTTDRFNRPTDVAVASNGDTYVADGYGNPYIHRFNAAREHLLTWGEAGDGPGQFRLPHSVWVTGDTSDERVYVCDRENSRIQVFTTDGRYEREFGGINRPTDIIVGPDGTRYVTELRQGLAIFAPDDSLIFRTDGVLNDAPGSFVAPHSVALDSTGALYITEVLEGQRVQKLRRL
jgi:DNA-binding beta-propeller fold protein YncE